jgi:Leucine-rich repeat (LRR) protein
MLIIKGCIVMLISKPALFLSSSLLAISLCGSVFASGQGQNNFQKEDTKEEKSPFKRPLEYSRTTGVEESKRIKPNSSTPSSYPNEEKNSNSNNINNIYSNPNNINNFSLFNAAPTTFNTNNINNINNNSSFQRFNTPSPKENTSSSQRSGKFQIKETQELLELDQKANGKNPDPQACFELGVYFYEEVLNKTNGSQEKYKIAKKYLQAAANMGHEEAHDYLDELSELDEISENQDFNKPSDVFLSTSNQIEKSFSSTEQIAHLFMEKRLPASLMEIFSKNSAWKSVLEKLSNGQELREDDEQSYSEALEQFVLSIEQKNYDEITVYEHTDLALIEDDELQALVPLFLSLPKLKEIYFSEHGFNNIPVNFFDLKNLTHLTLYIGSLKEIPQEISQLTNLIFLEIADSGLEKFPNVCSLPKLEELHLGVNKFSSIPKEIKNLKSLKQLDLQQCFLRKVPKEIGELTNLEMLNLWGNNLTRLPAAIWKLPNLGTMELDISHNNEFTQKKFAKKKTELSDIMNKLSKNKKFNYNNTKVESFLKKSLTSQVEELEINKEEEK